MIRMGKHLGVTNDKQAALGTRECDVESPFVLEEADIPARIAADTAEYNNILFLALEAVDSIEHGGIGVF